MRTVSTATTDAWKAAFKGGATRPMIRATIEKLQVGLVNYDMTKVKQTTSGGVVRSLPRDTQGSLASAQFCWGNTPVELPNIASLKWSRGVDSDVASATLTLWNTEPLPLGTTPTSTYEFDMPGYFSPQRGATSASTTRWGQTTNGWQNLIAPDRVVRTFEGYGFDSSASPSLDTHLYPSGVWLIDDVTFTATGMITVEMRDLGRMLMEHISFPPVVPQDEYPLSFDWYHSVKNPPKPVTTTGWFRPSYETSDVVYYHKAGYAGTSGGGVNGHYGRYAFDGNRHTYWMSLNNGIDHGHAYIQGSFSSRPVGAVKIKPWNGSYRAFISIYSKGKWVGTSLVPTHDGDLDSNMDIPFVTHAQVRKNTEIVVKLPRVFPNVTKIRVSLCHNGTYGGDGQHCGIVDITVSGGVTHYVDGGTHIEGDVGDYTDVVKWFLAWGGFFWTKTVNTQLNRYTHADGTQSVIAPLASDPMFQQGAIWGDLERAGVAGKVTLTVDLFDKKPLMDCIAPWTPILTPGGHKKIADIAIGDRVLTRTGVGRVYAKAVEEHASVVVLTLGGERVVCSPGHKWLTDRGWQEARSISVEDKIQTRTRSMPDMQQGLQRAEVSSLSSEDLLAILSDDREQGGENGELDRSAPAVQRMWGAGLCRALKRGLRPRTHLLSALRQVADRVFKLTTVRMVRGGICRAEISLAGLLLNGLQRGIEASLGRAGSLPGDRLAVLGRGVDARVLGAGSRYGGLADRSGTHDVADVAGGGRSFSPGSEPSHRRRREGLEGGFIGVDGAEVAELGGAAWARFGLGDSPLSLFDISVSGDPSFVVGSHGAVAHNCIAYIRDILGFNFWVDETGGAIWRSPNVWTVGNYLTPVSGGPNTGRTATIIDIVDNETITDMSVKMSSRSVRERVFVGSSTGQYGGVANGIFNPITGPYETGMRRVGGWSDQNFATAAECQIMADLITVRQMFTYRTNTISIPANPAIQIDDQVRVYERTTAETYLHYVTGISSENDLTTGKWTYQLDTHWLGEQPFQKWVFDPKKLAKETQAYLRAIGKI